MRTVKLLCVLLCVAILGMIVGGAECAQQTVFDLPTNAPGLQNGSTQYKAVNGVQNQECVHVIVPGTDTERALKREYYDDAIEAMASNGNIYFPKNGAQPTTPEAAEYSCANVGDEAITDWYVRTFGGDHAVEWSHDRNSTSEDNAPKFGFEKLYPSTEQTTSDRREITTLKAQTIAKHIITVDSHDDGFKKTFWKSFRIIASDPVGRVLLYRLLIEIRRNFINEFRYDFVTSSSSSIVEVRGGAIEDNNAINIAFSLIFLGKRNNCRSLTVKESDSNSFSLFEQCIKFCTSNDIKTSVLKIDGNNIKTESVERTADIGLFHEMLHWFHYLRDYDRYDKDCRFDGSYCHLMMCYFGNNKLQEIFNRYNELFAWATIEYKDEELRTILGTPNYNDKEELKMFPNDVFTMNTSDASRYVRIDLTGKHINSSGKFLNGDDLSENAYRMSKHRANSSAVRMRFGHADKIKPVPIVNNNANAFEVDACLFNTHRFMLPNLVARHCYNNITSNDKEWGIKTGEAAN